MFTPKEISENYVTVAKAKTELKWHKMLMLAVLAGAFIALAGALATIAASGASGMQATLIKGAVFPLGLILVVVCGSELFTGNCLLVAPAISREIKLSKMFKNLGIVYGGNIIGGVFIAVLVVFSHVLGKQYTDPAVVATITAAANKCNMDFGDALLRGILCNMLVCLAVWASMASKTVPGKILAVYLPVFAFVVCGFEHSVANMYYLSAGLMASAEYGVAAAGLTFGRALLYCLFPSTLGNIIGGCAIACAYRAVYDFKKPKSAD